MIDIIIPAYNAHKHIKRALDSIAEQTIKDLVNVYIIDDGSKNGYAKYIEKYPNLKIKEIKLRKNKGPGIARNIGLKNSNSEFLYFLDADDKFYKKDSLEILYKNMTENTNIVIGKYLQDKECKNNILFLSSKLFRRSFMEKYKIKFPNLRIEEPNTFCLSFVFLAKEEEIKIIEDIISIYFTNINDSITKTTKNKVNNLKSFIKSFELAYKKAIKYKKRNVANKYCNVIIEAIYNYYVRYIEIDKFENNQEITMFLKITKRFYDKYKKYINVENRKINEFLKMIDRCY
ncbi:MAG: glycosyltransferase family 2 protein [Firmicutes bacterium]|nr:glycosyltransferase family 2 protein [Bacillota bacterium]